MKGKKAVAVPEEVIPKWTKADVRAVEDRLLALGPHRTADVREQASTPSRHRTPAQLPCAGNTLFCSSSRQQHPLQLLSQLKDIWCCL